MAGMGRTEEYEEKDGREIDIPPQYCWMRLTRIKTIV